MKKLTVFAAFFAVILLSTAFSAYADVIPPKKQLNLDIPAKKVVCKDGLFKIINANGKPACVKPSSAEKLAKYGWAQPIDLKLLEMVKTKAAIGKVNTLIVTKVLGEAGKQTPKEKIIGYNYVFEVCATDKTITIPEIDVSSDSEAKHITLATKVLANTCETSATVIKASNPDSIKAVLTNKGGIADTQTTLENKVKELQEKIASEKSKLTTLTKEEVKPDNYKQSSSELSAKITELRIQLNQARSDLNKYLFLLHVQPSKANAAKGPLSFGGVPVEGELVNKLSIIPQVGVTETPPLYNVIYEVCAGATGIKAPSVKVESDFESKNIVLADRVAPNSCQMGTAKLKAENQDSITVSAIPTAEISAKISQLEAKILELEQTITSDKRTLTELTKKAQKPDDFDKQVTELTKKIVDDRNSINEAKTELYRILYLYYQ